jgi:hypothetical protein
MTTYRPYILRVDDVAVDTHKPLGSGGYGATYTGRFHGEDVAVKTVPFRVPEDEAAFWRDADLAYSLRDDGVVSFLGAYVEGAGASRRGVIVMRRMAGNLEEMLYKGGAGQAFPMHRRLHIIYQASVAVGLTCRLRCLNYEPFLARRYPI